VERASTADETAPEPRLEEEVAIQEPGPSRASLPHLLEILGGLPRLTAHPRPSTDEEWERTQSTLFASYRAGITRARAAEHAELDKGWAKLHEALERSRLLEERAVARCEIATREATEIRASTIDEAKEILAKAKAAAGEILTQTHAEAVEILAATRQRIHLTVGAPNPALAGEEAR
jgi:hypothetical protein